MRVGLKTSIACAAVVLTFCALSLLHVRPVNGPSYFVWAWRTLPWDCWLVSTAGSLPLLGAILWMHRCPAATTRGVVVQLATLMLASALFKAAVLFAQASPIGTKYAVDLVRSPWATSWFYDAARLRQFNPDWVSQYHQLVGSLTMHARNKPIGPVLLFNWVIGMLGVSVAAALSCAAGLIVLASTSIPATYACVKAIVAGEWADAPPGTARAAGMSAAALVAVAPGFLLFPVKFDSIWIASSAVMVLAWYRAIRTDRVWPWSIVMGATLAVQMFFGFHQLTLGIFLAVLPLLLRRERVAAEHVMFFVRHGCVVAGVVISVHAAVYAATGYQTPAVLQANVETQRLFLAQVPARRAPYTTLWDLYDFALGFGWCSAIVFVAALLDRRIASNLRLIGAAGAAQLLIIAVTALIAAETARCWLFMALGPLIAVGALLARWSASARVLFLVCVLLASLVLHATMVFNDPWPDWPSRMPVDLIPKLWLDPPAPLRPSEGA
jgi:hypothetical protein